MILHFSHIGLTEGRTFTLVSLFLSGICSVPTAPALATGAVAATVLGSAVAARKIALTAHRGMLAGANSPGPVLGDARNSTHEGLQKGRYCRITCGRDGKYVRGAQAAAARPLPASCQGVRIRGPSAVTATVNSKWAASDP